MKLEDLEAKLGISDLSEEEKLALVKDIQANLPALKAEQMKLESQTQAQMVIAAVKKIQENVENRFNELSGFIDNKAANITSGKDGIQGPKGEKGDKGDRGLDGYQGRDGKDGKDGERGEQGVGVADAKVDFDGSLVITLTDGTEINAGDVLPLETSEKLKVYFNNPAISSGGSALEVKNEGTSLSSEVTSIDFTGDGVTATNVGGAISVAISGGGSGISSADIQEFTSAGSSTWTKPSGAKFVYILAQGGGGGAGAGHKQAVTPVNPNQGGSGGGAGGWAELWIPAVALGSTETVTVGAGGTGGASQTTAGTAGANGTIGGNSSFGSWLVARGGAAGTGGSTAAQGSGTASNNTSNAPAIIAAHASTTPTFYSSHGGGRVAGTSGNAGGKGGNSGGGGGSGGGNTITPSANAGSAGGLGGAGVIDTATSATGGGGSAGTSGGNGSNGASSSNYYLGGSGGGGGASSVTANGGSGGNGGYPSGGGGGGGASLSGFNSGAGGNGGDGYVRIVTFF